MAGHLAMMQIIIIIITTTKMMIGILSNPSPPP
jgi:hypothetical protein